jgi:hypothetical protein
MAKENSHCEEQSDAAIPLPEGLLHFVRNDYLFDGTGWNNLLVVIYYGRETSRTLRVEWNGGAPESGSGSNYPFTNLYLKKDPSRKTWGLFFF